MGQRVIWLEDHTKLSETIVSIIEVIGGRDKDDVVKSWSGDTSLVVANAIKDVDIVGENPDNAKGVMRL